MGARNQQLEDARLVRGERHALLNKIHESGLQGEVFVPEGTLLAILRVEERVEPRRLDVHVDGDDVLPPIREPHRHVRERLSASDAPLE
jgi:hypothetical protein